MMSSASFALAAKTRATRKSRWLWRRISNSNSWVSPLRTRCTRSRSGSLSGRVGESGIVARDQSARPHKGSRILAAKCGTRRAQHRESTRVDPVVQPAAFDRAVAHGVLGARAQAEEARELRVAAQHVGRCSGTALVQELAQRAPAVLEL